MSVLVRQQFAVPRHDRHSFPTRRSSDLLPDGKLNPIMAEARARGVIFAVGHGAGSFWFRNAVPAVKQGLDRKSTRLNSSHAAISYAVFCLQKKKQPPSTQLTRPGTNSSR